MTLLSPKAQATAALAVGMLCGSAAAGTACADAPDGGMETTHGPSLITIDNSNADSWLEVDRTLNMLAPFSKGTAGSDHDGGGGAIEQTVTDSAGTGLQAAPDEDGAEEEEEEETGESAATGGDDPEGDADAKPGESAGARAPGAPAAS
ncbi:hypothetical protein [Streptomyces hoynatensis]|uniref:hypothetical protein n=1 Tax=Streptomyces hoynatensis TaxID=1141874 RepID=UPI001F4E95B6|nr:hypothetical protein [Streptomyces hoynatensis]